MKQKIIFLILLSSVIIYPQYFGERSTEQNFEQSELYFKSYYLNTFGLFNFKKIAAGFFNDPFLNLYINPASVPDLGDDELLLYADFRGDRTEVPIINNYVVPLYYTDIAYRPYFDPRWFMTTRSEPEPIFSLGILNYPLKDVTKNFFIGGTYQLINRQEKFYSVPYGIYYPNYYYDALGVRAQGVADVPIKDRYAGKDELSTVGHLFSAFAGYKMSDKLSVGISLNGVVHSRDGGYANIYQDKFGQQDDYDNSSSNSQSREQNYNHLDLSAGVLYDLTEKFSFGIKFGYLTGNADQSYSSSSNYFYQYKKPNITNEWNYSINDNQNKQQWNQDGNSKYIGFNFTRYVDDKKEFSGYYRFTNSDIDLTNSTNILDTSFYTSRYYNTWDTAYYTYNGRSFMSDIRSGTGKRKVYLHEALLNFLWKLTEKTSVRAGIYYNSTNTQVNSFEPITALRKSEYNYVFKNNSNNYLYELFENKVLEWKYDAQNWSLQIPIVFNFGLNDNWTIIFGLNRILNGWEIDDRTTAYFTKREKNENGQVTVENNFGERYTQPKEKITEDFTKILAGLNVNVSKTFKINLLLDPEFDNEFRLAQWWLSFTAKL
jgi:hypothetical protein